MIRSIIKTLIVGFITKKIADRSARKSAAARPAPAPTYPDNRAI